MTNTDSTLDASQDPDSQSGSSGAQGGQPNSVDVSAIVTELKKQLLPELDKRYQSVKDKRIASLEKEMADFLAKSRDALVADGVMDQETANQTLASLLPGQKQTQTTQTQTQTPAGSGNVEIGDVERKILVSMGLKEDDPDVVAASLRTKDFAGRMAEFAKIHERRSQPASQAAVSMPVGQSSGSVSKDALRAAYNAKLQKIRGDSWAISLLQKEYREKGLEI